MLLQTRAAAVERLAGPVCQIDPAAPTIPALVALAEPMTKFLELPVGARFEFEGVVYLKSTPLTAAAEGGDGQRMIPRSALVRPLGEPAPVTAVVSAGCFDKASVLEAVEQLYQQCLAQVEPLADGQLGVVEAREALAQARRAFDERLVAVAAAHDIV